MITYIDNFLLLCGLFLSPVKPKGEEDKAEDFDNDGDDGNEDEEDKEDVEVVEGEEDEEVGEVGGKVEDSSSSFRLVRRLSIGTKLSAALSCIFVEKIASHVAKDEKDDMLPKTKEITYCQGQKRSHVAKDEKIRCCQRRKRSHVAKDEIVVSKLWHN